MSGTRIWERASWPGPESDEAAGPRKLPGFVVSSFSPLVAEVADRCLRGHYGDPSAAADQGARTAVVLVSRLGDFTTDRAVAAAVDAGRLVQPLLFFQSVPNSVIGHVTTQWQLRGPVVSFSPEGDPEEAALEYADLLFTDGEADRALLLLVELSTDEGVHGAASALLVAPEDVVTGGERR
ncbi:beta-ketoacyl synthase chain length factor [Streptomyces sp. NPDC048506]|uniref:beta-ketoacyl synthase chain length factor n=1 Tax=Streptomyces sp. NPDC048506 TaxID=3155028 RepID=UPI00342E6143